MKLPDKATAVERAGTAMPTELKAALAGSRGIPAEDQRERVWRAYRAARLATDWFSR